MNEPRFIHHHLPEPATGFTDIILLQPRSGTRACALDDCIRMGGKDTFPEDSNLADLATASTVFGS